MITAFIAAALVGVAIGLFSGMLGVGGGTVMIPLFRLAFGLSGVGSTATSLFTIIPTSVSGAVSHLRGKTCVPKLGLALGIGGACTSPVGAWLANASPEWLVMLAAALCIAYSGTTMLRKALAAPKRPAARGGDADGAARQQGADVPVQPAISRSGLAKAALIGAVAGLASGYVGLGGGFIMVPLMLSFLNMPMKLTSGTSLLAILVLATPAAALQCYLGNVDYVVGIATACGSIPGAFLGAKLMRCVPERALRFAFAAFLLVAAVMLVVKEAGLLG